MQKKKRKFKHLTDSDRNEIEILLNKGYEQKEIAKALHCNPSTISRERKKRKRKNGYYDAKTAEHKAGIKRSNSKYQGMKIERETELKAHIITELKKRRSPNEISGRLKKDNAKMQISTDAIYKWLYSVRGQEYCKYLCTKRHKKKPQRKEASKREMIQNAQSIDLRPKKRSLRHVEGDLFVSPTKLKVKDSVALFCFPQTKLLYSKKVPNKKPEEFENVVSDFLEEYPTADTLTLDRGVENKNHKKFDIDTYFCDPHAPWQKPDVECNIGLLRRWFYKKGTDLSKVTQEDLDKKISIVNGKYRKSLGYMSAIEASKECGII